MASDGHSVSWEAGQRVPSDPKGEEGTQSQPDSSIGLSGYLPSGSIPCGRGGGSTPGGSATPQRSATPVGSKTAGGTGKGSTPGGSTGPAKGVTPAGTAKPGGGPTPGGSATPGDDDGFIRIDKNGKPVVQKGVKEAPVRGKTAKAGDGGVRGSDPLVVRTVEITTSDSTIGRKDIVTALAGLVSLKKIVALVRQPTSWQVTFSDIQSVSLFDENIVVCGKALPIRKVAQKGRDGTIRWSSPSVLLRVHWLPFFIEDEEVVRAF